MNDNRSTLANAVYGDRPRFNLFQLLAARGAIKLESLGMKHSSGRSVRKHWAVAMGLKSNAKHADVLAAIQTRLDEMNPSLHEENAR